jgi:hypothetical protein
MVDLLSLLVERSFSGTWMVRLDERDRLNACSIAIPKSAHQVLGGRSGAAHPERCTLRAARQGAIAEVASDPDALDYGGFMLLDAAKDAVVARACPIDFSMTADDVESWLTSD